MSKVANARKVFFNLILVALIFLTVFSGVTKILLMQQDTELFDQYGFTNPVLIAYGATQLIGGLLLVLPRTRATGAIIVAVTFLISVIVLTMAGKVLVTVVTLFFTLLLEFVALQSRARAA